MFGKADSRTVAQLALMDAVVFFAGAVLVSAAMLSYARPPSVAFQEAEASVDVARVLESVLSASIGTNFTVDYGERIVISSSAVVRDCLAVEAEHLFRGGDAEIFAEVNQAVLELAEECVSGEMDPHILFVYESYSEPLLAFPDLPDTGYKRYASHMTVSMDGGAEILLALVLCPPAPSEVVQI